MDRTTFVVQRCTDKVRDGELLWVDASVHDDEGSARDQIERYVVELGAVLGPFRIVRRTETVI